MDYDPFKAPKKEILIFVKSLTTTLLIVINVKFTKYMKFIIISLTSGVDFTTGLSPDLDLN